nr:ArmA_Rmt [uncultured bacterium]
MDERAQAALDALLSAKNLRDVCPETVRRVFMELLPRYRKPKDAEKAARTHLHQITGAFMTADAQEKARALLSRWNEGDESALAAALSLHASTRERLPGADEWMRRVSPFLGADARVLDLACGLNPILLGSMGVTNALGMDIHLGCVRLVNETARARRRAYARASLRPAERDSRGGSRRGASDEAPARAGSPENRPRRRAARKPPRPQAGRDLPHPHPRRPRRGHGKALRRLVRAHPPRYPHHPRPIYGVGRAGVSGGADVKPLLPARTLGGRGVGMEKHYADWFERILPDTLSVRDRFTVSDELVYLVERT